jgi:hypothetical protein
MEKKIINEITRIQELIGKKILVEAGTPTLLTKVIKSFEKNPDIINLLKVEKNVFKKFEIILDYAKKTPTFRKQLIKIVNDGISPEELKKLNDFKTFLIKYSNKDKTILKNTVNKKLDSMISDSNARDIIKLDFSDYVDNLKPTPKIKTTKPKTTSNNLNNVKINQVLDNEDEIILNKAIKESFINKKIPLKYIPQFKKEFINAVVKISNEEISKIPKETIDRLNYCIKSLDNTIGTKRQEIVNQIITDFEKLIDIKMPSREIDKKILVKRFKDFFLGKEFSKETGIIDSGSAFLKYWGKCASVSTGLYLTSWAADWYAQRGGSENATKYMTNKFEASGSSFLYRVLGGPIGVAYTTLSDFVPSMYNFILSKASPNKDNRKIGEKTLDKTELLGFKTELRLFGVLPKYIDKIEINRDGIPVYQYDENTQYVIKGLSMTHPNEAYITVKDDDTNEDKTFYLMGPLFKQ